MLKPTKKDLKKKSSVWRSRRRYEYEKKKKVDVIMNCSVELGRKWRFGSCRRFAHTAQKLSKPYTQLNWPNYKENYDGDEEENEQLNMDIETAEFDEDGLSATSLFSKLKNKKYLYFLY